MLPERTVNLKLNPMHLANKYRTIPPLRPTSRRHCVSWTFLTVYPDGNSIPKMRKIQFATQQREPSCTSQGTCKDGKSSTKMHFCQLVLCTICLNTIRVSSSVQLNWLAKSDRRLCPCSLVKITIARACTRWRESKILSQLPRWRIGLCSIRL